ncbi:hypothetical protein CRENBAI_010407 [Crenichthys baileyi]|uniref:Uncharacterized protein n=1 Tax=Crenichthys baileyi TaxID=28760 RepID=A0AAV9QT00_9TELE
MSHKEESDEFGPSAQTGARCHGALVVIRTSSKYRRPDDKSQQTPSTPKPSLTLSSSESTAEPMHEASSHPLFTWLKRRRQLIGQPEHPDKSAFTCNPLLLPNYPQVCGVLHYSEAQGLLVCQSPNERAERRVPAPAQH